jgi:flavin-dependent dehydrogenase
MMSDVVVVGGGPAGAAAAILCAQNKLRVTLVEGMQFPRDVPGETLHPGIESLLRQLGVAEQVLSAGFLRHSGQWVQWRDEPKFVPFGSDENGPWLGFQAWRSRFDAILLDRARALGVEILQPARAIRPLVDNDKVVGILSSEGELESSFVIDAGGSRHWLARHQGLKICRCSQRLIVRYGYIKQKDMPTDFPLLMKQKTGTQDPLPMKKKGAGASRFPFLMKEETGSHGFRLLTKKKCAGASRFPFLMKEKTGTHAFRLPMKKKASHGFPLLMTEQGGDPPGFPLLMKEGGRGRLDSPFIAADQYGWTWIAPVLPDLYQWTRLTIRNTDRKADHILAELIRLSQRGRNGKGADGTWRMVDEPAGDGYFLVGDSAAVLDPASSHGVLKAITSGMMAAHLITQVLHHHAPKEEAMAYYRHWLSNWFLRDIAKLTELYSIFDQ